MSSHDPGSEESTIIFDREAALATTDGDEELLCELVTLFLEEYPAQMAEIKAAIAGHDSDAIKRTAHALKGAVSNFGASPAAAAAAAIEVMGKESQFEEAATACEKLEVEMKRLEPELRRVLPDPDILD